MAEITQQEIAWLLEQEGLGEYEQNAFRALLEIKSASAAEISAKSGVPEAKLYEVLRKLEARGLVSSSIGRPRKFVLQNPSKALASSLARKRKSLEREETLIEQLGKIALQPVAKEETIAMLRGRETVLHHIVTHIRENVSKTIDGCFPFDNAYGPMMNSIKQKTDEGVKIRLLGEVTPRNYGVVKKYVKWGVEVRNCRKIVPPQPLRFSVYDNNAANFTLTDAAKNYITIWTDSEPVVRSISDLFTYYWSNGLKVD